MTKGVENEKKDEEKEFSFRFVLCFCRDVFAALNIFASSADRPVHLVQYGGISGRWSRLYLFSLSIFERDRLDLKQNSKARSRKAAGLFSFR